MMRTPESDYDRYAAEAYMVAPTRDEQEADAAELASRLGVGFAARAAVRAAVAALYATDSHDPLGVEAAVVAGDIAGLLCALMHAAERLSGDLESLAFGGGYEERACVLYRAARAVRAAHRAVAVDLAGCAS